MNYDEFESTLLDKRVESIKGLTRYNERKFNQWYAKEIYKGEGEIVDLGCMSGGSTASLASGLIENTSVSGKKIHAYDLFIKNLSLMTGEALEDIPIGHSFKDLFLSNVRPWENCIHVHEGDICTLGWSKEPIEYLLVDIMKSWDTAKAVTCTFFPFLIPLKSFVVQQDFNHWYTGWIHIIMYRLRDYLEPIYEIRAADSVVFKTKKAISKELCEKICDFSYISIKEIDQAFGYSKSLIKKNPKWILELTHAMFFFHYAQYGKGASKPDYNKLMDLAVKALYKINIRKPLTLTPDYLTAESSMMPFIKQNANKYFLLILKSNIIRSSMVHLVLYQFQSNYIRLLKIYGTLKISIKKLLRKNDQLR